MYCENCDLQVETEFVIVDTKEKAMRYRKWFDDDEVEGGYDLFDVGDSTHRKVWGRGIRKHVVHLRVDICANCAVPIRARTYLQEAT